MNFWWFDPWSNLTFCLVLSHLQFLRADSAATVSTSSCVNCCSMSSLHKQSSSAFCCRSSSTSSWRSVAASVCCICSSSRSCAASHSMTLNSRVAWVEPWRLTLFWFCLTWFWLFSLVNGYFVYGCTMTFTKNIIALWVSIRVTALLVSN